MYSTATESNSIFLYGNTYRIKLYKIWTPKVIVLQFVWKIQSSHWFLAKQSIIDSRKVGHFNRNMRQNVKF